MPLPIVDSERCNGCEACADICPVSVYQMVDGKAVVVAAEDCTACQACIPPCPQECIVVQDD